MSEPVKFDFDVAKNKYQPGKPRYESPRVISLTQVVVNLGIGGYDIPADGALCTSGCIASDCNNGASVG